MATSKLDLCEDVLDLLEALEAERRRRVMAEFELSLLKKDLSLANELVATQEGLLQVQEEQLQHLRGGKRARVEVLPEEKSPRWISTWKYQRVGSRRAKRLVSLVRQEEDSESEKK